ncbi:MAG: 2,3-bisphosphoglycerate-independent phosphoglycerate mutase [Oscillospiraceae bacterium]
MKYILVIGDGMADNPVDSLGGKTPIQAAKTPCIDALAAKGTVGNVCNCPKPLPAGSETAILSIFGCDPLQYFTGRSPMEAAASGIVLQPGDVAYRCNIVSLEDGDCPMEEKKILSHSAGSIDGKSALELVEILESDPRFRAAEESAHLVLHRFPAFRQLAVQSGGDVKGIRLTPPHDHLGEKIGGILPDGCPNAAVLLGLMRLAHEILDKHAFNQARRERGLLPANGIWFWAEGTATLLPDFRKAYGHWGGVISAVPLCHGIGVLRGLEKIEVEGATGELDTNFEGKLQATYDLLHTEADFALVHIEAPDECTHNGDLPGKIQAIEWLDSRLLAPLTAKLDGEGMDYRLLLLSDHKTLTATRGHDGDPVPYLLYDSTGDTDFGGVYDEETGMRGPVVAAGCQLLDVLFQTK